MNTRRLALLSALALTCTASYGCFVQSTGSGSPGAGGSASDGTTSSSSGLGGASTGDGAGGATTTGDPSGTGGSLMGCQPRTGAILAMTKIFYGDTNFDGTSNKVNGWKQYGFNVDGKFSTAVSLDVCKPNAGGAAKNAYPDGDNGIDNSFGRNAFPIFMQIASNASNVANQSITSGEYTLILDLEGLGAVANQASLTSKIYTGTPLGAPPKFDGSDCWPVAPEGLSNPNSITSAKAVFPMGSVAINHWDTGPTNATVAIQMKLGGITIHLDIHHAHLSMDLDPDHQGAQTGQLGGVIDTTQIVTEVKKVAGAFDPSLCKGATIESILTQLAQASDILKDGTQDPTKTCDGISIGLGFTAKALSLGGIGPAAVAQPDPCVP